jgi:hypothetical protein
MGSDDSWPKVRANSVVSIIKVAHFVRLSSQSNSGDVPSNEVNGRIRTEFQSSITDTDLPFATTMEKEATESGSDEKGVFQQEFRRR